MKVTVPLTPTGDQTTSFAAWGMFIDEYDICSGSYLVPGTISGPVFTNGAWTFGVTSSTNYIFTDPVGSVSADFGYEFGSQGCYESPNDPYTHSYRSGRRTISQTIDPDFQGGYQLGQPEVPLPSNDFSQKRAVLDGIGADTSITPAQMSAVLKNASGTAYVDGVSSGVYMPYTTTSSDSCPAPPCMTGGGIYVEGNASVTLSTAGTSPYLAQVTTIVQGGTTTTITTYPNGVSALNTAAQTTIASGAGSQTIKGVPTQYDGASTPYDPTVPGFDPDTWMPVPVRDATMVYVNGSISSLKGPGSGGAAIQDGSAMTVTAAGNMTITDDIVYKTKPVTTTQDEIPGTPPSTIIPENDNGQVLGLFTATGDIRMENCCGSALEIDASIATISDTGSGGLVNTGSHINTLTIIGGRIQNNIKNINATTRNVVFDRRFSQGGFAPPWFPSTQVTVSGVSGTAPTAIFERVQWLNQTPF
jgi:hypothetical protein